MACVALVLALDCADQHARGTLALEVAVVVREILAAERQVGVAQELLVLVAMRIEGRCDERARPDDGADTTGEFGFGTGDAARGHGAVHAEVDAVERTLGGELCDHAADVGFERLLRQPAGAGTGLRPEWGFHADERDAVELSRDLHEAAHVGFRARRQQGLAARRRSGIDEVVDRGVVAKEGHRLVLEVQDGDADWLAHARIMRAVGRGVMGGQCYTLRTHSQGHHSQVHPLPDSPAQSAAEGHSYSNRAGDEKGLVASTTNMTRAFRSLVPLLETSIAVPGSCPGIDWPVPTDITPCGVFWLSSPVNT